MSTKAKFTEEEEERIIDFVKSNEILYNAKHKNFRDGEQKNRTWLRLANDLGKDVEAVKKRWVTMRDYFQRPKKTTGSAATTTKRDESLSFLLQTSILKRATTSSLPSPLASSSSARIEVATHSEAITPDDEFDMDSASLVGSYTSSTIDSPLSQKPLAKKRKHSQTVSSDTSDILREFLANRPKPSDFLPKRPMDGLQSFFDSMCDTVRKFSPLEIAKIKFEIAQIVGKQEILCAENAEMSEHFERFLIASIKKKYNHSAKVE